MDKTRIVIVDDSPFQIALLSNILIDNGFEVLGSAGSLDEVKDVVKALKPDLVTMDMTIPGTDGLECTRAIHEIDSSIKVIVVSSMMDDEIIRKAKKNHVSGYIQKPVDSDEITLLINRIMANEELFQELESYYSNVFKEAVLDIFNKLTKTIPEFISDSKSNIIVSSRGVSIVLGIIGKYSGRMILDMSFDTASKLSTTLLKREPKNNEEMSNVIGEIANIYAGNACSMINKKNKLFGLRVAPPTIFHGESINISKGDLDISFSLIANSAFGEIAINIGFNRGDEEWISNI